MLLLTATTDKIQIITSAAVTIDVHTSFMDMSNADPPVIKGSTSGKQNTAISTAATTDIVAAPAASTLRNVKTIHARNRHATTASDVTVQFNQNGTLFELYKTTLNAGAVIEYVEGVGFYTVQNGVTTFLDNANVTSQTPFSSDTYLAGSNITIPTSAPVVGTLYHLVFDVTKTAAGTATPIITVRYGTAGSVADTSRCAFTFGAGTAAADTGQFDIRCVFRTVGSGTNAVIQGNASLTSNLTVTGLSNAVKSVQTTGGGFDSTVASSIIGVSYNGGASAAHTVQLVYAELRV